jgi:hypothetical protein
MKALKRSTLLFAVSLFALSCNNQTTTKYNDSHEIHHSDSKNIKLNNGERWMVNEEMKPFILEAEAILVEFIETGSTEYLRFAAQLKDKNSGLIKNCTMKGKSHDELHKWLHPHIDLIKELEQEQDIDKAKSLVNSLNSSFKTYHQYFQ